MLFLRPGGTATRNERRTRHSSPPALPSPAMSENAGVASEGMSRLNAIRAVCIAYALRCSACTLRSSGCLTRPEELADGGSRGSGITSCVSRNAESFRRRRSELGSLNVTTPITVSPRRYVVLMRVRTATSSPSFQISNDAASVSDVEQLMAYTLESGVRGSPRPRRTAARFPQARRRLRSGSSPVGGGAAAPSRSAPAQRGTEMPEVWSREVSVATWSLSAESLH